LCLLLGRRSPGVALSRCVVSPCSLQALVRQGSKGGYISALAVADGFRGRGVAKVLMAAAVEQIERDGATASQLVVRTH